MKTTQASPTGQFHNPPLSGRRLLWRVVIFGLFVLGACNLGTSANTAPPTLAPRASATPPPTLGFQGGNGGNTGNTGGGSVTLENIGTPIANPDVEIFSLLNQVDASRMMQHVEALQGFYTRHVNSITSSDTRGVGAARKYIKSQFDAISAASNGALYVSEFDFDMTWNGVASLQKNVVAVVQGHEAGAGTLVIGAHYDSIGPNFTDATEYAPGANDNGTGVAAIIEMARIMSQMKPRASIMFVAFAAEEVDRIGSRRFAQFIQTQGIEIIGMINVDTIGNHHDFSGAINDTELRVFSKGPNDASISRHMARSAEFISFVHGLEMKLIVEDAEDRERRYGDHFSFSELGYPAIRFINAFEEKKNGDPTDTIEFIEPDYLRRATQSILMVAWSLASGPRPPTSVTLRQQPGQTDALVWNQVPDAIGYVVALRPPGALNYDRLIETTEPIVRWDGFTQFAGIAVAARGPTGIIGPLSAEYKLR